MKIDYRFDRIELLEPVMCGTPAHIRVWIGNEWKEVRTSIVEDFFLWCTGSITITTRNSRYCGQCDSALQDLAS